MLNTVSKVQCIELNNCMQSTVQYTMLNTDSKVQCAVYAEYSVLYTVQCGRVVAAVSYTANKFRRTVNFFWRRNYGPSFVQKVS